MSFDFVRTLLAIIIVTIQSIITVTRGNIEIGVAGVISIGAIIILYRTEVKEILSKALKMIKR
ncbi:MAG: hypothetical protein ACLSA0_17590 [Eisenbergiella massiliensis]